MRKSPSISLPEPHPTFAQLARAALPIDTIALARFLIGSVLVREADDAFGQTSAARIVETEAYVPLDAASHAFIGETARNGAMFLERGRAYVYFIYGNHYCLNVVSERAGVGAAVLIRAAEPLSGAATLRARSGPGVAEFDLLRGPGRLARALGVDRRFDRADLCARGPLQLAAGPAGASAALAIGESVRIGVRKNADARLRFFEIGNPRISGPKSLSTN